MKVRPSAFRAVAAAAFLIASQCLAADPATSQPTSAPARVAFDNQCFTIDGKDTLIYSASFHYFRCPKPLWHDRFKKLKEAGFNTVETYVAWNWHEKNPPKDVDDFSQMDLTDLNDWLTMAEQEFGFNVIIRPGPYICAEWDGGGYPQWLALKRPADFKGMWYRSDDPEYLKWCRHWYQAVAKVVVPHQLTHKQPGEHGVIFWQIENEYNYAGKPEQVMLGQLLALGKMSKEFGIDVPLFTCVSHNPTLDRDPWMQANVFDTYNAYPAFNVEGFHRGMGYLNTYQPDKPKMITELQGGWFATLGNKLSDQQGHNAAQIQQLTMFAWSQGFTSTNYYMGFGGTNIGDWAAASLMTSYDYNAPLREAGGVGDRYLAVKGMGQFIGEHGAHLARATAMPIDVLEKTDDNVEVIVRKAPDGTMFVFARTEFRDGPLHGTIRFVPQGAAKDAKPTVVYYDLPPFGEKVCVVPADGSAGTWYPKPQAAPERPANLPAPMEVTEALRQPDSFPAANDAAWKDYAVGKSVEDFGIFDRRTVVYRSHLPAAALKEAGDSPLLRIGLRDRDSASVFINGQRVRAGTRDGNQASYPLADVAKELGGKDADVAIVYENGGRPNGGAGMERRNGLTTVSLADAKLIPHALTGWRLKLLDSPDDRSLVGVDVDDKEWRVLRDGREGAGDVPADRTGIYRASVELTADEIAAGRSISLRSIDDRGWVYVNGTLVGESTNWSEPFVHDVTANLKPGRNVIAVIVQNTQGDGGLTGGTSIIPRGALRDVSDLGVSWQMAPGTVGMTGGWSADKLDDGKWQRVALTGRPLADAHDSGAPLVWYRMKFTLPANDPHAWVPWFARLNISGNAFLYLNGQPLGRYWNAGPQRDFFLPDCWLRPGAENVLTACVRGDEGAEVRSLTVMPYADQAEAR